MAKGAWHQGYLNKDVRQSFADFKRISKSDLRQRISRFRSARLNSLTSAQIAERIKHILDQCPLWPMQLTLNGVYRARVNSSGAGLPFKKTADLWYPPAEFVRKPGRFNRAYQSVFYAANNAGTAVNEVRAKPGDVVTIVRADATRGTAELSMIFLGLWRSISPDLESSLPGFRRRNDALRAIMGRGEFAKFEMIDEFLADLATAVVNDDDSHAYEATVAISNLFGTAPRCDGLIYPSVVTALKGVNICISPDVADRCFVPAEAWMVQFGDYHEHAKFSGPAMIVTPIMRTASIRDGQIVWAEGKPLAADFVPFIGRMTSVEGMPDILR